MIYRVTAHFMLERADEYLTKLTDGTIKSQSPDGGEIVDAMNSVSSPWQWGTGIRKLLGGWVSFGRLLTRLFKGVIFGL